MKDPWPSRQTGGRRRGDDHATASAGEGRNGAHTKQPQWSPAIEFVAQSWSW